ncbi:MAG: 3'-5' exonuclease [Calothrix sp. MO_167.B42]|nr:3'-5' exonuclease [Calothrix sp. MO_167.B42]
MFLKQVKPTPEQRKIFFLNPDQPTLLSDRAGSGKTTTAILRAKQLINFYKRQGLEPRVGFFVFNNTLKNYLEPLANIYLQGENFEVWVIDKWCKDFLETRGLLKYIIADDFVCKICLQQAIQAIQLRSKYPQLIKLGYDFLVEEINYLLGRFGFDTISYIESERIGRGSNPNIDKQTKRLIAEELIPDYQLSLQELNYIDWNDLREQVFSFMQAGAEYEKYDILVVDEAQDLSASQIKILLELTSSDTKSITFIRDTTQRIYKNNYIWDDINLSFGIGSELDLEKNYRNTREIAMVAASLMQSVSSEEYDIDILDPDLIETSGLKPVWLRGRYIYQQKYLLDTLGNIDIYTESVGILHIQTSSVNQLAIKLQNSGYDCFVLKDEDNLNDTLGGVYVSTLHSAKGLEFDHVFIVGYDEFFAPGPYKLSHRNTSAHLSAHRKLLYTAITRARKTLTITSSINEYSQFLKEIDVNLLQIIEV